MSPNKQAVSALGLVACASRMALTTAVPVRVPVGVEIANTPSVRGAARMMLRAWVHWAGPPSAVMSTGFAIAAEGESSLASWARSASDGSGSSRWCRPAASAATIPGPPEFVRMERRGPPRCNPAEKTFAFRKSSPIDSIRSTPDCSKSAS